MRVFVGEMNRYAKALGMENTGFNNPHGLADNKNKSSAADIGKIACIAMQDPIIKQIVCKTTYECKGRNVNGKERKYTWTNTHRLLDKGFSGIKTGWTPAADSCLAASYEKDGMFLIIIVVACTPIDIRWTEVPMLTLWAVNRLERMMEFFSTDK